MAVVGEEPKEGGVGARVQAEGKAANGPINNETGDLARWCGGSKADVVGRGAEERRVQGVK